MVEQVDPAPEADSHCVIIASIATIFAPISFRTCSVGKPFGCRRRCFASGRQVAQSHDHEGQYAMRHGGPRGGAVSLFYY